MGKTKQTTDSTSGGTQQISGSQNQQYNTNETSQLGSQQSTTQQLLQSILSTLTPTATGQEQNINNLDASSYAGLSGGIQGANQGGLDLAGSLTRGGALPGAYGNLYQGVSPADQDSIVKQSLRDIPPSLQAAGLEDSGVGEALYAKGAQNVRSQVAQFNTQNLSNLFSQALTGGAAVQAPILANQSLLSGRLQGLRSISQNQQGNQQGQQNALTNALTTLLGNGTSSGNFNQNGSFTGFNNSTSTQNPFLESFYSSLGQNLGTGGSATAFSLGSKIPF